MTDLLPIALIAGLLALDERAGWQSLLSEPVFSAAIIGALTGVLEPALQCGLVLQFVWLTIGQPRGTRRANVVVGGVVGAGTVCLVQNHTGEPNVAFVVAMGVVWGLVAGEFGARITEMTGSLRERRLEAFKLPADRAVASRNLTVAVVGSALFVVVAEILQVLFLLPTAAATTEALAARVTPSLAAGAKLWITVLPAFALVAVGRAFYQSRNPARFAIIGFAIGVLLL